MRSPAELAARLTRQWHNNATRAERLLTPAQFWPLLLPIGKPTAIQMVQEAARVQQHIQSWRKVRVGQVEYESVRYQRLVEPVELPVRWRLNTPSEWVQACQDVQVQAEFAVLSQLIETSESCMHELLVRERSLWRNKPLAEVQETIRLAARLEPGCAGGQPLRLLSGYGVDTKFVERNETLLRRLLDTRFAGAASEQGLLTFLDALEEKDHWLLLRPLENGLLPFERLRLTSATLAHTTLPASRVLVVENERCEHVLPPLADCIAILGAGLDLAWLGGPALQDKQIYYWGDLDTWGLTMLARARQYHPSVQAVLMSHEVFAEHAEFAVVEPQQAGECDLSGLNGKEVELYRYLQQQVRGRLEQEFISQERVRTELAKALSGGLDC